MLNGRMESGKRVSHHCSRHWLQAWVCLTSLLMMLEASVNSNLMKFTDDAKSRGVTNSSEGRAKP